MADSREGACAPTVLHRVVTPLKDPHGLIQHRHPQGSTYGTSIRERRDLAVSRGRSTKSPEQRWRHAAHDDHEVRTNLHHALGCPRPSVEIREHVVVPAVIRLRTHGRAERLPRPSLRGEDRVAYAPIHAMVLEPRDG